MQTKIFLVVVHDADDEDALDRRNATRPAHFARIVPSIESGQIIMGGGMLNDDGEMVGSAFFGNFASREDAQQWCDADPYVQHRVWSSFEITEMKIVVRESKLLP